MWEDVFLFIVDETSMLGANALAVIDERLRIITQHNVLFGGILILFVGDFYQLVPVKDIPVYQTTKLSSDKNPIVQARKVHGTLLWQELTACIILTVQHRQTDPQLLSILKNLRTNTATQRDIDTLNTRVNCHKTDAKWANAVYITPNNKDRQHLNRQAILNFANVTKQKLRTCWSKDTLARKPLPLNFQAIVDNLPPSPSIPPRFLQLGQNMPIIITRNINKSIGIINGARGTVYGYSHNEESTNNEYHSPFEHIFVTIPEITTSLPNLPPNTVPLKAVTKTFEHNHNALKFNVSRKQLPIEPAFAITTHKGMIQPMSNDINNWPLTPLCYTRSRKNPAERNYKSGGL
jgi:hypothetical protein